jgi:hypothetical protein
LRAPKISLLTLLILPTWCGLSLAQGELAQREVEAADINITVVQLREDLELIRAATDAPINERPPVQVTNAAPRDVYFQALTLRSKAERLCGQHSLPDVSLTTPLNVEPERVLQAGDVLDLVVKAYSQIRCAKQNLGISQEIDPPARDPSKTMNDIHQALVQANRQANLLLTGQTSLDEVYAVVRLANSYATAVLDGLAPVWRSSTPSTPPNAALGDSSDTFDKLAASHTIIEDIAKKSGLETLHFEAQASANVLPSDVLDLAALIVSELRYFVVLVDTGVEFELEPTSEKSMSDVFQEAMRLEQVLQNLQKIADLFPNWWNRNSAQTDGE